MNRITVLLADDHAVVREGLRALLALHPDIEVVGEANDGWQAVAEAKRLQPHVVIMDIAMPSLNGREATQKILKVAPESNVLVLTCYHGEECVKQMLEAGATGYILKNVATGELAEAVRAVRRGVKVMSSVIGKHKQAGSAEQSSAGLAGLTARENQVLRFIVDGFSNPEIAVELGISIKTVEKHRQQVMNKLDIHHVAGLTRFAIEHGMVQACQRVAA